MGRGVDLAQMLGRMRGGALVYRNTAPINSALAIA
jgi:hypothetical protein